MPHEFSIIDQYFKPLSQPLDQGEVGIGDDGALLNQHANCQLVVVTDTMVSGVHYPEQTSAFDIGWKLLAVNLSDLAAMGAQPKGYSLAVTLPAVDESWLRGFTDGLQALAREFHLPLIGGDTTRGAQTVLTLSALGEVPTGLGILRNGAQTGDLIAVSGVLGSGGLGLEWVLSSQQDQMASEEVLKLNRPQPRVALGQALRQAGWIHSMIDISDGLVADIGHICKASACAAVIGLQQLPMSPAVKAYVEQQGYQLPLAAGDDYELCFTFSPEKLKEVHTIAQALGEQVTVIGQIIPADSNEPVRIVPDLNQSPMTPKPASHYLLKSGFQHF
ncbi:thiamine-phosphate kinase [Galenea microaerophila]